MKNIFNLDGIAVTFTGAVMAPDEDPGFEGVVTNRRGQVFRWSAFVRPRGYEIWITELANGNPIGCRVMHDSATWNLGLEVSVAVQRAGG